jgi:hypothetical protein
VSVWELEDGFLAALGAAVFFAAISFLISRRAAPRRTRGLDHTQRSTRESANSQGTARPFAIQRSRCPPVHPHAHPLLQPERDARGERHLRSPRRDDPVDEAVEIGGGTRDAAAPRRREPGRHEVGLMARETVAVSPAASRLNRARLTIARVR